MIYDLLLVAFVLGCFVGGSAVRALPLRWALVMLAGMWVLLAWAINA